MKILTARATTNGEYPYIRLLKFMGSDNYVTSFLVVYHRSVEKRITLGYTKLASQGQVESESPHLRPMYDGLPENFFSLGQHEVYYRKISSLSKAEAKQILTAMRDVAYSPEILRMAEKEPAFKNSLARGLGAIKSLNYFYKKDVVESDEMTFNYGCELNGSKTLTTCTFNFYKNRPINGSINILIGKNGCGKSQYLANLVASLTGENLIGEFSENDRQQFDKVIAVSYSVFDRFFLPDDIKIKQRERHSFIRDQLRYKYIGMRDKSGDSKIVKVASSALLSRRFSQAIQNIEKKGELNKWIRLMTPILKDAELEIESNRTQIIRSKFKKLGAGHKATLSILTGLYDELVFNSLVVVDEPENHLHPALLGYLMQALQEMLSLKRSVAIVATHSPIIVQEFPSKYVRVIRKTDGESEISELTERSFGRSLDSIISNVFAVPSEAPGYMTVLEKLIKKGLSLAQIEKIIGEQLGPAARSFVTSKRGGN